MDMILAWGLDVIRAFQSIAGPVLTAFMKAVSFCGTEYFYMALLTGLYWCVDRRRGARIVVLVLLSTAFDLWLKTAVAEPRPFDFDRSVGLAFEPTYGFPSNHAQNAVVFWCAAAALLRGPWRIVVAALPPLLIGLSRIYLGVHFPTDVLAGWAFGGAFVWLYYRFGERIERFLSGLRRSLRLAAAAVPTLAMIAAYREDVSMAGTLFGFALGLVYFPAAVGFSTGGSIPRRILRYALGLVTVAVVYAVPKLITVGFEAGGPPLVRFLRYAALGLWAGAGAPWLFMRLRLAEPSPERAGASEDGAHSA